mmetsp:Transcript_2016/g.4982  ORF Transcript_2016/g.4982 Transcript_2016/m.4982 type:complete len:142 (+) Transcript_2016:446-871(+)
MRTQAWSLEHNGAARIMMPEAQEPVMSRRRQHTSQGWCDAIILTNAILGMMMHRRSPVENDWRFKEERHEGLAFSCSAAVLRRRTMIHFYPFCHLLYGTFIEGRGVAVIRHGCYVAHSRHPASSRSDMVHPLPLLRCATVP